MARELFPVFLDLHGRDVAVVGGGAVATERAAKRAAPGARVRLVSPDASPPLAAMAALTGAAFMKFGRAPATRCSKGLAIGIRG